MLASPRIGRPLGDAVTRVQNKTAAGEGDPRADTPAAAAHVLGVLWASASRGATVKELRAAIGLTRERLEAAYAYLLAYPLLGLTVLRQGDDFLLVTSGQVAASVERHLNAPRSVALSGAAMQVLTIVAYRQPVSQAGIESVRGTSSDSAVGTLLQRQLIALDDHRLFTTTAAFLKYLGLRDLADLPPLPDLELERLAPPLPGDGFAPNEATLAGHLGVDHADLAPLSAWAVVIPLAASTSWPTTSASQLRFERAMCALIASVSGLLRNG